MNNENKFILFMCLCQRLTIILHSSLHPGLLAAAVGKVPPVSVPFSPRTHARMVPCQGTPAQAGRPWLGTSSSLRLPVTELWQPSSSRQRPTADMPLAGHAFGAPGARDSEEKNKGLWTWVGREGLAVVFAKANL